MSNTIKSIIFDFDGTIADTIHSLTSAINLTMDELGLPRITVTDTLSNINHGARHLIKSSLPEDARSSDNFVDHALEVYNGMYAKTYLQTEKTYDGMTEVLCELKKRGYKIAVLSNKQDKFLVDLCKNLLPDGSYVVARGQLPGVPAKPDPTAPLEVAAIIGSDPCECAFVGDSHIDIRTAKNAGMKAVGVSWGYRPRKTLEEEGAEAIADMPCDLLKIFM